METTPAEVRAAVADMWDWYFAAVFYAAVFVCGLVAWDRKEP